MIRRTMIAALMGATLLSGCKMGPTHIAPLPPPPAAGAFVGSGPDTTQAALPADWWRLFDDPAIDAHVRRALEANADIRVALGNLQTARGAERLAKVPRLPATVIESGAGPDSAAKQPSTASVPKTGYELGATLAYEVDLFGRISQGVSAASADAEASQVLVDAARVMVVADTVAAYIDICGATVNAAAANGQLAALERNLSLVRNQLREGEVSPLEVAQASNLVETARAALPVFEADRRRALFRLATLEARPPAEAGAMDVRCTALPRIVAAIPVGDGAGLIARRPDIREAERRLAAATARIGVATADLYPRIQLGGSAGLISGGLDAILTPLITWAFPNQTAARSRIAQSRGTQAAALATWDVAMLRALREVETALSDIAAERQRNTALVLALSEGEKAAKRAGARFRLGADSYLLVLTAERARNDAVLALRASDLRIAQGQVTLFRALGGGWQPEAIQVADAVSK